MWNDLQPVKKSSRRNGQDSTGRISARRTLQLHL
jgi:hypothetical protein